MLLAVAFITPQMATTQEDHPFYWKYINVDIDVVYNHPKTEY